MQRAIGLFHRAQAQARRRRFQHPDRPQRLEGGQRRRPARMRHPVGKPQDFGLLKPGKRRRHRLQVGAPGHRRQPGQPPRHLARRGQAWGPRAGAGHQRGQAPGPAGLLKSRRRRLDPRAPVRRRRPAVFDKNQQRQIRPGHGRRSWVQHRPGKAQDHRRQRQQPQRQQPPRRAVRGGIAVLQPQQQRHAGKAPAHRCGRHRPQQQPYHRQRQQPDQHQRRGKSQGADHPHQARASNA